MTNALLTWSQDWSLVVETTSWMGLFDSQGFLEYSGYVKNPYAGVPG